jgi:hypothetical protein
MGVLVLRVLPKLSSVTRAAQASGRLSALA